MSQGGKFSDTENYQAAGRDGMLIALFSLIIVFSPVWLSAQTGRTKVEEGNRLYKEQKFDEAMNKYKDASLENPTSPVITFNTGDVYYQKKNFEEALKQFEKATSAQDIALQSQAYYNSGNALFKSGKIAESILSYKKALELNPNDNDVKFNLEYARAILKEHAKKEPQQQQQQQQQQQGNEQKEQQGNKDQQQKQDEQKKQEQQGAQEQKEQPENKDKKDVQQEQPKDHMSKEQAEQILRALENNEKEDLKNAKRQQIPAGEGQVLKDW